VRRRKMNWITRKPTADECDTIDYVFATVEHHGKRMVIYEFPWTIYEEWERWHVVAWKPFEFPEPYKGEA
jgi:hypothetical protein